MKDIFNIQNLTEEDIRKNNEEMESFKSIDKMLKIDSHENDIINQVMLKYIERASIKIEKDEKYDFPIKKSQAIEIAQRNENLKTDYIKNTNRGYITYLNFENKKVKIVKKNNKKYWQLQVISGDVSGIKVDTDGDIHWDGWLGKEDLKKLRCLIDVETGEYIYYPVKNTIFKKNFRKF